MCRSLSLLLALAVIGCGAARTTPTPGQEERPAATAPAAPAQQAAPARENPPSPAAQTLTVGSFNLRLNDCRLNYEGAGKSGEVSFTGWPGPCRFSRDREGQIRIVRTGRAKTLLVESSKPGGGGGAVHAQTKDCLTYVRGIVVTAKQVLLSVQTQKVAQCLPAVWDEKMFHVFAARTEPVSNK
jgi:hypothetical protein